MACGFAPPSRPQGPPDDFSGPQDPPEDVANRVAARRLAQRVETCEHDLDRLG